MRDHVQKALGKENPDLLGTSLCDPFFTSIENNFPHNTQKTYTRQNQILLAKNLCSTEVTYPSGVPRSGGKLMFIES